jgi:hypothetical protein
MEVHELHVHLALDFISVMFREMGEKGSEQNERRISNGTQMTKSPVPFPLCSPSSAVAVIRQRGQNCPSDNQYLVINQIKTCTK